MANPGKLTAVKVAKLTERGRYADGGNLYLQISQWGTKSWILRYMQNGKARTMGLGDLATFSLSEARQRARAMRQLLADGIDPLQKRREAQQMAKIEAARTVTFKEAASRYISAHDKSWRNEKHRYQWNATVLEYACGFIGGMDVAEIETNDILRVLEPIWTTKPDTAERLRGRLEAVIDWATARKLRTGDNPARWKGHLKHLLPEKKNGTEHYAALPWGEMPAFMAELRAVDSISARALEFTILTAARTGETLGAQWDEIDFDAKVWTIPGARMKAGREHRVPLCDGALKLLKGLSREHGNPYVFPGARRGRGLSNLAMLMTLRRMGYGQYTVHGFRSSFRDWAAEQTNFPREIAEACLAHTIGTAVERSYRRGDFFEKRRRLMDAWASYCAKPAGNGGVVPIRKAVTA